MNKKQYGIRNVGMTSIVLIFAVLCLTVFSTLSYMTAFREQILTNKTVSATEAYFEADWQAEEYYEMIQNRLSAGMPPVEIAKTGADIVWNEDEKTFGYCVKIDSAQELQVKLKPVDDKQLKVIMWKTVATGQWESDSDIRVWDGE